MGPISDVHILKILDEYRVEVANPSICKLGDVTYVMISRETERFATAIHTHEAKKDAVENCSKILRNPKKACLTNKER